MDRREFFRRGFQKATRTAVEQVDARVTAKARHWLRPPFALHELDFLLACTRCGECSKACPHQVIFPLPAKRGVEVASTPALDLLNKGCRLCQDWPCVLACEAGALALPQQQQQENTPPVPSRLAEVRIDTHTCLPYQGPECGACASACPVPGAMRWEGEKPQIIAETCLGCGLCREACIVEQKAIGISTIKSTEMVV